MSKYEFVIGKDVLPEKVATMKRFEYSSLSKELKAQTDIAKKQYQGLNKFFKSDKKEEPVAIKKYNKSDLIYKSKYSFCKYHRDSKRFDNHYFKSKYYFLEEFFKDLNKFNNLKI